MIITFISDTHSKQKQITSSLPGGDILIHAGDATSMGYRHEIQEFMKWMNGLNVYDHKVFIAGNHDWGFQDSPKECREFLEFYNKINYLEDDMLLIGEEYERMIKVWGTPWQPEFHNWAFNLPRNGDRLKEKWELIPQDIDILITHGPPFGHLDAIKFQPDINLGCELLRERIEVIKPKIHVFGHIHTGYGYKFDGNTHYFNAAVLDERYNFTQKPLTVNWNPETNEIEFL